MATATSSIVDAYGRPIQYATGRYPSPSRHPIDNRPKAPTRPKIYEDQTTWTRQEQVNYSRVIATQVNGVDAALTMKNSFAVGDGWEVSYSGTNRAWGDEFEALVNGNWMRSCNALGEQHDWRSTLRTLGRTLDVEADYAVWFDTATGRFAVLDQSRIGTGQNFCVSEGNGLERVLELGAASQYQYATNWLNGYGSYTPVWRIDDAKSPFDGRRIIDGVIVDDQLRVLGYRILGYNPEGKLAYADVWAWQVHFNFEAGAWLNQVRGIPSLANLIDDANTVMDILYYWGQGVMIASQKMVYRKSIEGRPSMGAQETEVTVVDAEGDESLKLVTVEAAPAGVVELSTRRGEELGTLDLNRPSMDERELVQMLETAFLGKHWPRALVYAQDMGRAGARAITQQVQNIIGARQMSLERSARWVVNRYVAWAMDRGLLTRNQNLGDPYDYGFTVPALFSVDEGNDGKLQLNMLGRGVISRGTICAYHGVNKKKILRENVADVDALATEAEGLATRHGWLTAREALTLLDNQGNPNVQPQPQPAPEPQEPAAHETGEQTNA